MTKLKKMTREEMLEKKRKAERVRYDKIKRDPLKYEEQKQKEKIKYQKKKESGQVKAAKDMTPRENRLARKRWRDNVKAFRQRRAALTQETMRFMRESTPDSVVIENNEEMEVSKQINKKIK